MAQGELVHKFRNDRLAYRFHRESLNQGIRKMYVRVKNYHAEGFYPLDRISNCPIPAFPGVYVVQGQSLKDGELKVVDVGQTKNLRERFELHHPRMDCWRKQGLLGLSVAIINQINYKSRLRMENDLRDYFKPPCWWK